MDLLQSFLSWPLCLVESLAGKGAQGVGVKCVAVNVGLWAQG